MLDTQLGRLVSLPVDEGIVKLEIQHEFPQLGLDLGP